MTRAQHAKLWAENRNAIIAARRRNDDGEAARLSQERQGLKRHRWCHCGVVIRHTSIQCLMHSMASRYKKLVALPVAMIVLHLFVTAASAATPCVTNFTITITAYYNYSSITLSSPVPCTPAHPDQWTWIGACILASGNSCTNLTDGSQLAVDLGYVPLYDTDVGYVTVQCVNGHVQAHQMHITVPAGHQKASYKFYADCDATSTCDDVVCVTPL